MPESDASNETIIDAAVTARKADLVRFRQGLTRMDERSSHILSYHSALEVEVQRWLDVHLPRGNLLKQISFGHKINVIRATWFGDESRIDDLADFLLIFNNLGNAIAHGDDQATINAWIKKIKKHYEELPGSGEEHRDSSLEDMVADICGTLAGITYQLSLQRAHATGKEMPDSP